MTTEFEKLDSEVEHLAHGVIGAAIEVHKILGPGFLEAIYEEALCVELKLRGIPFKRQYAVAVNYKDHPVGEGRLDLLIGDKLIVEIKAVNALLPLHTAQLIFYLKSTGNKLGLLVNFKVSVLKDGIRRVIL